MPSDAAILNDRLYLLVQSSRRPSRIVTFDLDGRLLDPVGFNIYTNWISFSRSTALLYGLQPRVGPPDFDTVFAEARAYILGGGRVVEADSRLDLDWTTAFTGLDAPSSVVVDGVMYVPADAHGKVYGFRLPDPSAQCTTHLGKVNGARGLAGAWLAVCLRGEWYYKDYQFDLAHSGEVVIGLESGYRPTMTLWDAEGNRIAGDVAGHGETRAQIRANLTAGPYRLGTSAEGIYTAGVFELSLLASETSVPVFKDDPIRPGVTPVRGVHFEELRTRINALRNTAGLGPFSYTDPVLRAGVTPVRLVHLLELRAALADAYRVAGRAAPSWTDSTPAAWATPIRAVHLTELRAGVIALEPQPEPPQPAKWIARGTGLQTTVAIPDRVLQFRMRATFPGFWLSFYVRCGGARGSEDQHGDLDYMSVGYANRDDWEWFTLRNERPYDRGDEPCGRLTLESTSSLADDSELADVRWEMEQLTSRP